MTLGLPQVLIALAVGWLAGALLSGGRGPLRAVLLLLLAGLTFFLEVQGLLSDIFGAPWTGSSILAVLVGCHLRVHGLDKSAAVRFLPVGTLLLLGGVFFTIVPSRRLLLPQLGDPSLQDLTRLSIAFSASVIFLLGSLYGSLLALSHCRGDVKDGFAIASFQLGLALLLVSVGEAGTRLSYELSSHGSLDIWWRHLGGVLASLVMLGSLLASLTALCLDLRKSER